MILIAPNNQSNTTSSCHPSLQMSGKWVKRSIAEYKETLSGTQDCKDCVTSRSGGTLTFDWFEFRAVNLDTTLMFTWDLA